MVVVVFGPSLILVSHSQNCAFNLHAFELPQDSELRKGRTPSAPELGVLHTILLRPHWP